MRFNFKAAAVGAGLAMFALACGEVASPTKGPGGPSFAKNGGATTVYYGGQGLTANGDGSYVINLEICGVENGADAAGSYLLWVFTATGATSANITGPWGTVAMTKTSNGTFKYISAWYSPLSSLIGTVFATVTGGTANNPQLTISHGCAPKRDGIGAWCSPGYWLNTLGHEPNGWETIGVTPPGPLYTNVISAPVPSSGTPTLLDVLQNKQLYFSSTDQGAAFNAVGGYLTGLIPGYFFDPGLVGTEDSCPIDAFGRFKS
jgi:hypothetical protein